MRASHIGAAHQAAKDLLTARVKRQHLIDAQTMTLIVECQNGRYYDEMEVEVEVTPDVLTACLAKIDAEIAVAEQTLAALGVTDTAALQPDPLHGDEDDAADDSDDYSEAAE